MKKDAPRLVLIRPQQRNRCIIHTRCAAWRLSDPALPWSGVLASARGRGRLSRTSPSSKSGCAQLVVVEQLLPDNRDQAGTKVAELKRALQGGAPRSARRSSHTLAAWHRQWPAARGPSGLRRSPPSRPSGAGWCRAAPAAAGYRGSGALRWASSPRWNSTLFLRAACHVCRRCTQRARQESESAPAWFGGGFACTHVHLKNLGPSTGASLYAYLKMTHPASNWAILDQG